MRYVKRITAFFLAVVVAVGCMTYRPQKAYAFAFAPALIPVAVSLLAACGIFITYTSATDDLESVIDDFLSSDAELGGFVNGIYEQSLLTGSVALTAAQIAFFTDVFIAQAYSYFSKVNSDMDLSGTVWHPIKDLFGVRIPFGATVNYRPDSLTSWGRFVPTLNGSVWQINWYAWSSSSTKPTRTCDAVADVSYFYLQNQSYFSSGDYYQMQYYTVNSSGDSLRFNLGYSSNPLSVLQVSAVTIGSIGYCTKGYATAGDLELKTGYLRDTSVSADAIKASILAADEVYVTPLTNVSGLSTYNNSVVGVYEDGLIGGVVLDPDAVIDPTIPVDPEIPVTGDLTGIAGGIQSILNWLKGLIDKLINALSALLTALFVPTDTALQNAFDPIMVGLKNKMDLSTFEGFKNKMQTLSSPPAPNITMVRNGVTYTVVDFTSFNNIRDRLWGWLRGYLFVFILLYNMNFVYRLIRGQSMFDGMGTTLIFGWSDPGSRGSGGSGGRERGGRGH